MLLISCLAHMHRKHEHASITFGLCSSFRVDSTMSAVPANAADRLDEPDDVGVRLRKEQQKLRHLRESRVALWKVACCIFTLAHPDPKPSVAYISKHGLHDEQDDDEIEQRLVDWYVANQAGEIINNVSNTTTKRGQRQWSVANKFFKEYKLHIWIEKINMEKGIAPSTAVLSRARLKIGIEPTAVPFVPIHAVTYKSKLQWLRRWRRRWDVNISKFGAGERLASSIARDKVAGVSIRLVSSLNTPKCGFRFPVLDSKTVPPYGPHFGPP